MLYVHFRGIISILLLLGGGFYRYVLGWFLVLLKSSISFLTFCLVVLSIIEGGVVKSPTIVVEFVYFFWHFHQFWLYVFWCFVVQHRFIECLLYSSLCERQWKHSCNQNEQYVILKAYSGINRHWISQLTNGNVIYKL